MGIYKNLFMTNRYKVVILRRFSPSQQKSTEAKATSFTIVSGATTGGLCSTDQVDVRKDRAIHHYLGRLFTPL